MSTLATKLKRGWSAPQIKMIRIRPDQAQAKAQEDDKSMREAAELLDASRLAIRRLLSNDRTFGDNEAALQILNRLDQ